MNKKTQFNEIMGERKYTANDRMRFVLIENTKRSENCIFFDALEKSDKF